MRRSSRLEALRRENSASVASSSGKLAPQSPVHVPVHVESPPRVSTPGRGKSEKTEEKEASPGISPARIRNSSTAVVSPRRRSRPPPLETRANDGNAPAEPATRPVVKRSVAKRSTTASALPKAKAAPSRRRALPKAKTASSRKRANPSSSSSASGSSSDGVAATRPKKRSRASVAATAAGSSAPPSPESVENCTICLESVPRDHTRGTIDSCSHAFCFDCISEWAKTSNTCPVCTARFSKIERAKRSAATSSASSGRSQQQEAVTVEHTENRGDGDVPPGILLLQQMLAPMLFSGGPDGDSAHSDGEMTLSVNPFLTAFLMSQFMVDDSDSDSDDDRYFCSDCGEYHSH